MRRFLTLFLFLCLAIPVLAQTKDYSQLSLKELSEEYDRLRFRVENSGREQFAVAKAMADKGNFWGLSVVGKAYLNGDKEWGVPRDYSKALYYYDKGAKLGSSDLASNAKSVRAYLKYKDGKECTAEDYYFLSYLFGSYALTGGPYFEDAVVLMEKAYQGGYAKARKEYLSFLKDYTQNSIVPGPVAEFCAQRLFQLSGDKSGYEQLGDRYCYSAKKIAPVYYSGDPATAYPLYEKALKYGSAEAAYWLAEYAFDTEKNPEKALPLYEAAIKLGYPEYIELKYVKQAINQRKEDRIRSLQRQSEADYHKAQSQSSNIAGYVIGGALIAGLIAILNSDSSKGSSSSGSYSSSSSYTSSSSSSSSSSSNTLYEGDRVKCMIWRDGTCGYYGRVAGKYGDKVKVYIDDVVLKGIMTFWIPASQETGWKQLRYYHGYDYDFKREYFGRGDTIEVPEWCLTKC